MDATTESLLVINGHSIAQYDQNSLTQLAGNDVVLGYVNDIGINSRFNRITDFLEGIESDLIIVDSGNNCLRRMSFSNSSVEDWVGLCTESGSADGFKKSAKFLEPFHITKNSKHNRILVTESTNRIRAVEWNGTVHTIYKFDRRQTTDFNRRRQHAMAWLNDKLLVTDKEYVLLLNVTQLNAVKIKHFELEGAHLSHITAVLPNRLYALLEINHHSLAFLNAIKEDFVSGPLLGFESKRHVYCVIPYQSSLYFGTNNQILRWKCEYTLLYHIR